MLWKFTKRQYPGSIAVEYVARNAYETQFDAVTFCDIVRQRVHTVHALPSADTLVVHLRMGDVFEMNILPDEIDDVWKYGVTIVPLQIRNMINGHNQIGWWNYVKTECAFQAVLPSIPKAIKKVILVGTVLHKVNEKYPSRGVSLAHRASVKQFFERAGLVVSTRDDGLPDEDIVWMSHAKSFVSSGGGFSRLANMCVKELGGMPLDDSAHSCNKQDRPPIPMRNYSWESHGWHGRGGSWDSKTKSFANLS